MELYEITGARIREIRSKKQLTQAQVAEKAGISAAFLSFLESGRKQGSLETYSKLSNALGVRLDVLFRGLPPAELKGAGDPRVSLEGLGAAERQAVEKLVRVFRAKGKT